LGLEDKIPDHSTFSKNRHGRFAGTNLFREMFYEVVRQAQSKGSALYNLQTARGQWGHVSTLIHFKKPA